MILRAAVATAILGFATNAFALDVAGWDVDEAPNKDNNCQIAHEYKDSNGGQAAVAVGFVKKNDASLVLIVSLAYEPWDFKKDEKLKADILVDEDIVQRSAEWVAGEKIALTWTSFKPTPVLQSLSLGKSLALRFNGKKEDPSIFGIENLNQALAASLPCVAQLK